MSDLKKFEEMLERLINEDKEGAEELFHEIVVEKSREIYESLLEDDLSDEEVDEAAEDEEVDEAAKDDDEDVEEASEDDEEQVDEEFDLEEFEVEADPMAAMGGDPADDMMGDVEVDGGDMDMGDEEGEGEGDIEDRVMDLEDALDDLKAEFDKLMAGEEDEPEHDDMDMGDMGDEEGEEGDEEEDEAEKEAFAFEAKKAEKKDDKKGMKKSAAEEMREYVEKVGGATYNQFGKMGDNGANTKSTVAGKNDMGGTASNLAQGKDNEAGDRKGFAGLTAKEDSAGNVNVPGAKGATSMKGTSGHGAEKKGKAPEKSGSDSPINGVKSRAK